MRVLDLFSGIGGFSLGLERAGMKTVAFCEIDLFCRKVLAKHWPLIPCHDDIRTFQPERGSADVVCGGPPCQPNSSAARGRVKGQEDNRYLWPEMLRVVGRVRPRWVVGENVVNFGNVGLEPVVSTLENLSYEVATFEIPACAVGHDHRRSRIWIVGYSDSDGKSGLPINGEVAELPKHRNDAGIMGTKNGIPSRMDRLRALGNAVVPQIVEVIGRAIMAAA